MDDRQAETLDRDEKRDIQKKKLKVGKQIQKIGTLHQFVRKDIRKVKREYEMIGARNAKSDPKRLFQIIRLKIRIEQAH